MAGKKILTDLEVKGYIDIDGGIKDKNDSTGNASHVLHADGTGRVYWTTAPSASVTKVSKYVAWNTPSASDAGVTFQNTSAGDETNTCTITHNLSTYNVIVSVIDNYGHVTDNGNEFVDLNYDLISVPATNNTIKLYFKTTAPPTSGESFNVTIIG